MKIVALRGATVPALALVVGDGLGEAEWQCRNAFQLECNEKSCEALDRQETSTMELLFNSAGEFAYCAYSGCWSGTGEILSESPYFVILARNAEWSVAPDRESRRMNILIAFDPSDHVAIAKVGGWAHPFNCTTAIR